MNDDILSKEKNYYYCIHEDFIAERIGEILEDMGIFNFSTPVRDSMNLFGILESKSKDIISWYKKNINNGGRVNVVIFMTRFFRQNAEKYANELRLLKVLFMNRKVNIYTIMDEDMRSNISCYDEDYNWMFEFSTIFDVTNRRIISDTADVARNLAMELVYQRCNKISTSSDEIFSSARTRTHLDKVYVDSIASAYNEIPVNDFPCKFLLLFSAYKYVEHNTGCSNYGKCMEYLLKRSVKKYMMSEKDLELSMACLFSEISDIIKNSRDAQISGEE